jgi:hypothetical protein
MYILNSNVIHHTVPALLPHMGDDIQGFSVPAPTVTSFGVGYVSNFFAEDARLIFQALGQEAPEVSETKRLFDAALSLETPRLRK